MTILSTYLIEFTVITTAQFVKFWIRAFQNRLTRLIPEPGIITIFFVIIAELEIIILTAGFIESLVLPWGKRCASV